MKLTQQLHIFFIVILTLFIVSCTAYRFDQIRVHEKEKDDVALIEFLQESPDGYIRAQAAQSLGRLKSKKATEPLIQALKDKDWGVRYFSAESLGKIKATKAEKPLKGLLKTENEEHVVESIKKALKNIKK